MLKFKIAIFSILLAAPVLAGNSASRVKEQYDQKEKATSTSVWAGPVAFGLTIASAVAAIIKRCLNTAVAHNENQEVPRPLTQGRPPSVPRLQIPPARLLSSVGSQEGAFTGFAARDEDSQVNGFRILIIDDEQLVTMSPRRILGRVLGNEVVWVQDAQAALDTLDAQDFDLILMDHHMPLLNGLEMTQMLRNEGIETIIVSHSTALPEESKAEYEELGVTEFFDKSKPRENDYRDLLARLFND